MAQNIFAPTPEAALDLLFEIASEEPFELGEIDLGEWAQIDIYIPKPEVNSSITPPYMEAFLLIQKQLLQLAALAKSGVADSRMLTESEIRDLTISVQVSNGSSDLKTRLAEQLIKAIPALVKKVNGRQVTIIVLGTAVLLCSTWAFSSWLENERVKRLDELKTQEHIVALDALKFADKSQSEIFKKVLDLLGEQGSIGKRAADASSAAYDALLRAASKTNESVINGQSLKKDEAETLRVSPRRKAKVRIVRQEMRVIDINTEDPLNVQFVLLDEETGDQFKLKLKDSLFAELDRGKLFASLEKREPIWVELAVSETQGEIKSVEFLRVTEPPQVSTGD